MYKFAASSIVGATVSASEDVLGDWIGTAKGSFGKKEKADYGYESRSYGRQYSGVKAEQRRDYDDDYESPYNKPLLG
jgi:hypothetical protein